MTFLVQTEMSFSQDIYDCCRTLVIINSPMIFDCNIKASKLPFFKSLTIILLRSRKKNSQLAVYNCCHIPDIINALMILISNVKVFEVQLLFNSQITILSSSRNAQLPSCIQLLFRSCNKSNLLVCTAKVSKFKCFFTE